MKGGESIQIQILKGLLTGFLEKVFGKNKLQELNSNGKIDRKIIVLYERKYDNKIYIFS